MKHLKSAFAALLLLLALTGCGMTTLNATGYVQGLLDETYLGTCDDTYLALVDLTEEEVQADYQAGLEAEARRFAEHFQIKWYLLSQDARTQVCDYLGEVYAKARYTVDHATRSDSGAWLVEVTVQPVCTFASALDELPVLRRQFEADAPANLNQQEEAWTAAVLALCRSTPAEYGDPVTIAVRIVPDENDIYAITAQDFYNLDALILTYEN